MPGCTRPVGYVPRQTHECDAAVLVRRHLAEFLERCEERAGPLPAFVKAELEGFAGCGDFELGFVRTCCRSCGDELRVPFSCKSRGCCPSCMGRRMAEGAALLVEHVLPAVGYRQWVLSFPGPMAVRLGYDAPLLAAVAGRLARAVMQDMRRGVKQQHGLASVAALHAGVVTAPGGAPQRPRRQVPVGGRRRVDHHHHPGREKPPGRGDQQTAQPSAGRVALEQRGWRIVLRRRSSARSTPSVVLDPGAMPEATRFSRSRAAAQIRPRHILP